MDQENRVVVLIDMDCFYCQVEEKLNPELKGMPIAVVQYNPWKGGGIIAVNYEARAMGVTRGMRGDEAKEKCPEIQLPSVPCQRGKADITKYREAGKEVARVLQKFTALLERASIDEAYLDITLPVEERLRSLDVNTISTDMVPNTFALGYNCVDEFLADVHSCVAESIDFEYDHAKRLLIGAVIVSEIRATVYEETGYRCSAGIAHNKILAKLVCGMNKPNKQTILPKHSINILYKTLPLKKVKHLGGKFGDAVCDILKIKVMSELQQFAEKELQTRFDDKNGSWLYNIARGIDLEHVQARFNPKSIGCCKQFRGKAALLDLENLTKWLKDLGDEIEDRLETDALENNRTPKQMVVSYSVQMPDGRDTSSSRSYNFNTEDELCGETFYNKALELIIESSEGMKPKHCNRKLKAPIKFLGISVGKFEDNTESKKTKKIVDYFAAGCSKDVNKNTKSENKETLVDKVVEKPKSSDGKDFIMKKFFQVKDDGVEKTMDVASNVIIEASLDKQESFFAKMLKNTHKESEQGTYNVIESQIQKDNAKPRTPNCEVMKCGDDSNDTDYSGSTINNEINKSIALFEDEPQDIARISNIRQLLNCKQDITDIKSSVDGNEGSNLSNQIDNIQEENIHDKIENIDCPECRKSIPLNMIVQHSDYHLALKLREEERQIFRDEKDKINKTLIERRQNDRSHKQREKGDRQKINMAPSIEKFVMKVDKCVPTEMCVQCGTRIVLDKLTQHLDFHEAQKLRRELKQKSSPIKTNTNRNVGSVKRKKKMLSPTNKTKLQCKSIDTFFMVRTTGAFLSLHTSPRHSLSDQLSFLLRYVVIYR
ncbi:hypothetical protein K1T71_003686 [Dendrolimus kikuchii]|uniref:Uncharacterized protein n=1 Tax=Dendrolimus kikuchii TaxID=765133 RepID=A0ACC1D9N6_9NEOP|nr:hypothetical protein K1T71_003686 [Dendrolimus kikuchii]